MLCFNCGENLSEDAVFCPKCGAAQNEGVSAAPAPVSYAQSPAYEGASQRTENSLVTLIKRTRRAFIIDIIIAVIVGGLGLLVLMACLLMPEVVDAYIVLGLFVLIAAATTRVFGAVNSKKSQKELEQIQRQLYK